MKNESKEQIARKEREMREDWYNSLITSEQKKLKKEYLIQLKISF